MPQPRRLLLGIAGMALLPLGRASAQSRPKIRIGVLTDLSGPYRDTTGLTSIACARQAVDEFNALGKSFDVELISADHQNKADVAAAIARQWFDSGVDAVADVPNSACALAVGQIAREKDRIMLNASATSVSLTGDQCSPNTVVWSNDTYMLAKSQAGAIMRAGGDSWFFITADYAFGHSLEAQTTSVVLQSGGKVVGRIRYPFPDTADFSAFLQQASASGAKVLGLANAGSDTVNSLKQAKEFSLDKTMQIAPLLLYITDVHALGLDTAAGLVATESFYWDLNDDTRAFTKRIIRHTPDNWPNMGHASAYAITRHYLKAVADIGPAAAKTSGVAVVERMKAMPTDDEAFGKGRVRIDGRGVFPAYSFRVKHPAKSKGEWDLYELASVMPGLEAIRPLNETGCSLVKS